MTPSLACPNLSTCSVLELVQHANRAGIAYHLVDDRLIVRPSRSRQEIADAVKDRAGEVAAFLQEHGRGWRTPAEEDTYRRQMADEMTLAMFGMEWQALVNLTIDSLADRVGDAWERYVNRLPLLPLPCDDLVADRADEQPAAPIIIMAPRSARRRSFRDGGRRGE